VSNRVAEAIGPTRTLVAAKDGLLDVGRQVDRHYFVQRSFYSLHRTSDQRAVRLPTENPQHITGKCENK